MQTRIALVSLAALSSVAAAGVADFDFEAQSNGDIAADMLVLSSQGVDVTFSAPGLQIRFFGAPFPDTNVLSSTDDAGPIEIMFSQDIVFFTFENIINGRFNSEVDFIDGFAYDSDDNLVDSFTMDSSDTPFLESLDGISRIVLEETNEAQGFVIDNVVFRVPAPSAAGLLGLGGLVAARRRRA